MSVAVSMIGSSCCYRSSMVGSSQMTMSTDVTHIQTVDSVPVAQIQQTTFVQLLLQWHCIGSRFLLI